MVEDGMDKKERQWQLLMFMLHLADISGQAKGGKLFLLWTDRCMEEFFQQGDEETKLGLPISPNCDRKTVLPAESQCGFIQFVIAPAYEVLGLYSSFVQETIIPQIHSNHAYWVSQSEVSTTSASEIEEEEVQNDTVEPKIQPAASVAECWIDSSFHFSMLARKYSYKIYAESVIYIFEACSGIYSYKLMQKKAVIIWSFSTCLKSHNGPWRRNCTSSRYEEFTWVIDTFLHFSEPSK